MNLTGALGTMAFANPWVLAGLAFLPALWFLLRITPPAPRRIVFPAARFAADLIPETSVPSRTPWPILLLRLSVLALLLLALARPVLNPGDALPGQGPLRLVIDNGWAAARSWDRQMEEAKKLAAAAGREKRDIYILGTAPEPGSRETAHHGPLTQAQADSVLRGLSPLPWPADYDAARKTAEKEEGIAFQTYWLSHGLKEGDDSFFRLLAKQGELTYVRPDAQNLPVLLRPNEKITQKFSVLLSAPPDIPSGTPVTVNATGAGGRVLDSKRVVLGPGKKDLEVVFDGPDSIRNRIQQVRLGGHRGAGAVLLLDDQFKRRDIGIAAPSGGTDKAPFLEEAFYLERALEPYANIVSGPVKEILSGNPSVIVLPNVGALPPDDLNALEQWIRKGGLLLRFAGPNMTQGENFLMPVPILKGGRALDGAMAWEKPVKLAPFPENSPLYGLPIPEEITIRQQLLAQPAPGLEEKTWAALEDGTPLVTADRLEDGLIVLVHTSATPLWSDLPLSGFFIDMLRRFINLAGSRAETTQGGISGVLQPLLLLDGNGATVQPKGFVQPIRAEDFEKTVPGPMTPPGLYGRAGYRKSLNLGERLPPLETFSSLPLGVKTAFYEKNNEVDLLPPILAAAFILFIADWLLMTALQIGRRRFLRPAVLSLLFLCLFFFIAPPTPAFSQTPGQEVEYAGNLYLAYMKTGNPSVDATTQKGIESLAGVLKQRTSAEPSGVVGVTPDQELSFFPFIYWAITQDQKPLPEKSLQNIQHYIDHGGTVFFDTRDRATAADYGYGTQGANAGKLRAMIGGLDIPPLIQAGKDHVIGKSFYLLNPGESGTIWVEEQSAIGRDGVSSIIIANNDWASLWAQAEGAGLYVGRGSAEQEMALRFGINLVMYALTGNYKTDQVHLQHILERLGQ